jgi:hypothetical protein
VVEGEERRSKLMVGDGGSAAASAADGDGDGDNEKPWPTKKCDVA